MASDPYGLFDVSTAQTARLGRPRSSAWSSALMLVSAATVAAGADLMFEAVKMHDEGLAQYAQVGGPAPSETSNNLPIPVSPSDDPAVQRNPALKAAYDSSVFLVAFDDGATPLYTGSGAILKNTISGGEPVVMTVQHVLAEHTVGQGHSFIAAFDHDRRYLGIVEPARGTLDYHGSNPDAPALVSFDNRYPVNQRLLSKIPGITLATEVPSGPILGLSGGHPNGGYGIAPGDSGAAILIEQGGEYRAVAVVSTIMDNNYPDVTIRSEANLRAIPDAGVPGGIQQFPVKSRDESYFSSLGDAQFLQEVKSVTVGHMAITVTSDNPPGNEFYTFGFGRSIPKVTTGTLLYDQIPTPVEVAELKGAMKNNATDVIVMLEKADQHELAEDRTEHHRRAVIRSLSLGGP